MNLNTAIASAISHAIAEVNLQQPAGQHLANAPDQPLLGAGAVLDSLGILLFVTALEAQLKPARPALNLVDALMDADNATHFASLGALQAYLRTLA